MNRRQFIGAGAAVLASSSCLRAPAKESLEPVKDLAVELLDSLNESIQKKMCVSYDHPLRQYHNRGVSLGGARVSHSNFSWKQLKLLNRLFYAGLSEAGQEILPHQHFIRWTGIRMLRVLMAGDPSTPHFQLMFSGPHMNLRLGGKNREGVAFGGPIVYGDQRGNNRQGLPGNVYRDQFLKADELFARLSPAERQNALLKSAPIQTQIEFRGDGEALPGIPVGAMTSASKVKARGIVQSILKVYPPDDVAYAWNCLEKNGGVDALHLSYYRDGEVDGSGRYQIFRLEGPAAVFYFRGAPHVHAFINVGMDGNNPLSVGKILGENPVVLEDRAVKDLFERAMREATSADFAYYDIDSAVGRLRKGVIRTGDIYNLESWVNTIHVVTLKGNELRGRAEEELVAQGVNPKSTETYTIATTDFVAEEELRSTLGGGRSRSKEILLRDATIEYLKKNGFPSAG